MTDVAIEPAWTADRDGVLKNLHREGLSYDEIADLMGVSRNAALGRGSRLGLKRTAAASPLEVKPLKLSLQAHGKTAKNAIATAKAKLKVAGNGQVFQGSTHSAPLRARTRKPGPNAATLANLTPRGCKMFVGEPMADAGSETLFCGEVSTGEGPYCATCRGLAYAGFSKGAVR